MEKVPSVLLDPLLSSSQIDELIDDWHISDPIIKAGCVTATIQIVASLCAGAAAHMFGYDARGTNMYDAPCVRRKSSVYHSEVAWDFANWASDVPCK